VGPLGARFGCETDPDATAALVDKHALTFGWRHTSDHAQSGESARCSTFRAANRRGRKIEQAEPVEAMDSEVVRW
jgi:hypothetical protein